MLRKVREEEKVLAEKSDEFGNLVYVERRGFSLLRTLFGHHGLLSQIKVFSVNKDALGEVC